MTQVLSDFDVELLGGAARLSFFTSCKSGCNLTNWKVASASTVAASASTQPNLEHLSPRVMCEAMYT